MKQRVPIDDEVMIRVFLLQVRLGDDSDIDLVPIQIHREVRDCVLLGDDRSVEDVQGRCNPGSVDVWWDALGVDCVMSRFGRASATQL